MDRRMEVFAGQGPQRVGMLDSFMVSPTARRISRMADEIVGLPLTKISSEGPINRLTETSITQPLILTYSIIALSVTRELCPQLSFVKPLYVFGHSLGEYAALVARRAMSFENAVKLVRRRGLLMEEANDSDNPGRMAAIEEFGNEEEVGLLCSSTGTYVANLNGGQVIISGVKEQMDEAEAKAGEAGWKVTQLRVSCAAHSPLMEPVRIRFEKDLAEVEIKMPDAPVISNVTGKPYESVDEIRAGLSKQLVAPVQLHKFVICALEKGVDVCLEYSPKRILAKLIDQIDHTRQLYFIYCIDSYNSAQNLSRILSSQKPC